MAAGPPRFINAVVEVVLHMQQEGSERAYVFHFRRTATGAPTVAQLNEFAQNFWIAIQSSWNNLHSTTVNASEVVAKDISGPGLNVGSYTIPQPHPGVVAGTPTPANAAAVISWRTGRAGRKYRGRTYLCGISDAFANGSTTTGSYLTVAAVFANVVAAYTNSGGLMAGQFCIASFTGGFDTLVTAFVVNNLIDSQRRRLIGRGN